MDSGHNRTGRTRAVTLAADARTVHGLGALKDQYVL